MARTFTKLDNKRANCTNARDKHLSPSLSFSLGQPAILRKCAITGLACGSILIKCMFGHFSGGIRPEPCVNLLKGVPALRQCNDNSISPLHQPLYHSPYHSLPCPVVLRSCTCSIRVLWASRANGSPLTISYIIFRLLSRRV